MTKAILLLDVDGVLNAVTLNPPRHSWPTWHMHGAASLMGQKWPITWSPEMCAALQELHSSGEVEIRWLTTWWNEVDKLAFLGFPPDLKVEPTHADHYGYKGKDWWKIHCVQQVVEEGRPVIWIDDDITYDQPAMKFLRSTPMGKMLAISPVPERGIEPHHIKTIKTWLAALT